MRAWACLCRPSRAGHTVTSVALPSNNCTEANTQRLGSTRTTVPTVKAAATIEGLVTARRPASVQETFLHREPQRAREPPTASGDQARARRLVKPTWGARRSRRRLALGHDGRQVHQPAAVPELVVVPAALQAAEQLMLPRRRWQGPAAQPSPHRLGRHLPPHKAQKGSNGRQVPRRGTLEAARESTVGCGDDRRRATGAARTQTHAAQRTHQA